VIQLRGVGMKQKGFFAVFIILALTFTIAPGLNFSPVPVVGNQDDVILTGTCTSGISNLYITVKTDSQSFGATNYSHVFAPSINDTALSGVNFTASKVDVDITELKENPYYFTTSDNVTGADFPVGEEHLDLYPSLTQFAQYFKFDNLTLIRNFKFYVNYSCNGIIFYNYRWWVDFYRADDLNGERVNHNDHSISWWGTGGAWTARWLEFDYNEFLDAGEYYAVIKGVGEGAIFPPGNWNNNSWQVHDYGTPSENVGASLYRNSSGWFNISNDATADFMMSMEVTHYYDPDALNIKVLINDQAIEPIFIRDPTVYYYSVLRPILKGQVEYFLTEPPTENLTINVTLEVPIVSGKVDVTTRYIHLINATGNFTLTKNSINWVVDYEKINSSSTMETYFLFPNDWDVDTIYDSRGIQILEYGILYSYIYMNDSYDQPVTGVWIIDSGNGETTFQYTVRFHSPNYLSTPSVFGQVPFLGYMAPSYQHFVGEVKQISLQLSGARVTEGEAISYTLLSPLMTTIDIGEFTYVDGQYISPPFNTFAWIPGNYVLTVTWTDGSEIGYLEFYFALQISPAWGALLILVTIGLAGVVSYRIIRRRLRQRNWHKKIDYLFVMTKVSGRPMYSYSFGGKIQDPTLISGFLSAISSFVKEAVKAKSEHLSVLDQEDKKIIIVPGQHSNVVLVTEINLPIMRRKASEFIKDFEKQYHGFVVDWIGDTSVFKGAEVLVLKHFPITMEDKLIRKIGIELAEIKEKLESVRDPARAISIVREATDLTSKYTDLVRDNFQKLLNEIMKLAQEKMK